MFSHGRGVPLQVHHGDFVPVIVGGCRHSGYKVAIGSIASHRGHHTQKGIFPCCAVCRHGEGL
jgi:hypothetical protein